MYYAQLDPNNNTCIAVIDSDEAISDPNFIEIGSFNSSYLGKLYNKETNEFVTPEPALSNAELTIMESLAEGYEKLLTNEDNALAIMGAIADLYEMKEAK